MELIGWRVIDKLLLLHLHLNFKKEVPELRNVLKKLGASGYPHIAYEDYTIKEYKSKKRYSMFSFTECTNRLVYTDILYDDIPEYHKLQYLRLLDKIPPYSSEKFLAQEFYNTVPSSLIVRGLIKPVAGGIVLLKERGE
jgi:hypothetical protein